MFFDSALGAAYQKLVCAASDCDAECRLICRDAPATGVDMLYLNHQHLQRFYEQQDQASRMHGRESPSLRLPTHDPTSAEPPPHPGSHLYGLSDEPPNMADEGYREGPAGSTGPAASGAVQMPAGEPSETLSTSPGSEGQKLGTPRVLLRRFLSRHSESGISGTELTALSMGSEDAEAPLLR